MSAVLCVYVKDSRNWQAVFAHICDVCKKYAMSFYISGTCPPFSFLKVFKDAGFGLKQGYRGLLFDPSNVTGNVKVLTDIVIPGMVVDRVYSDDPAVVSYFFKRKFVCSGVSVDQRSSYHPPSSDDSARWNMGNWMNNADRQYYSRMGRLPDVVDDTPPVYSRDYAKRFILRKVNRSFWDRNDIVEYVDEDFKLYMYWKSKGGSETGTIEPAREFFWILYHTLRRGMKYHTPVWVPSFAIANQMLSYFYYVYSDNQTYYWKVHNLLVSWFGDDEWIRPHDKLSCGIHF